MEAQHASDQQFSNHLLAQAFLAKPGDSQNRLLLTERSLQVYYRGKSRAFSLEYVQQIALEHRKLWLPLIGGGILTCLCLLALMQTYSMPYRLLAGAALGLLSFWWGYRGSMALVVYEQRHHTDFLIPPPTQPLAVFVAFANLLIRQYPQPLGNYGLLLSASELEQLKRGRALLLQEPRTCYPAMEAARKSAPPHLHCVFFNPFQMGERLHWSLAGRELQVHLQGTLEAHELQPAEEKGEESF